MFSSLPKRTQREGLLGGERDSNHQYGCDAHQFSKYRHLLLGGHLVSELARFAEKQRPVTDNFLGHEIKERSDLGNLVQVGMCENPEVKGEFRQWIEDTDETIFRITDLARQ